jgi:hypothetical protein
MLFLLGNEHENLERSFPNGRRNEQLKNVSVTTGKIPFHAEQQQK